MNTVDKAKKYYLDKVIHTVKTTRPDIREIPFMEIMERHTAKPVEDKVFGETLEKSLRESIGGKKIL